MTVYKPEGRRYYVMDFVVRRKRVKRSTKRTNRNEALMVELAAKKRILDSVHLGDLAEIKLRAAVEEWWQSYGSRLRDASRIKSNIRVMFGEATPVSRIDRAYSRKRQWVWDSSMLLHELNEQHFHSFINARLSEGISAATIIAEINILRRTERFLKGKYATPKHIAWPTFRTDKRLIPNRKQRFLTHAEVCAFLHELDPCRKVCRWPDTDYRSEEMKRSLQDAFDLAIFMLHTGCRPSEAFNMLWDDVDLNTRTVEIKRIKSANSLWTGLVMSDVLKELLTRRKEEANSQYIFPDRTKGGPRRQCRAIKKAMDRAGLNEPWKVERYGGKATMYTLRDTYASLLAQSGEHTLHEIRDLLGHTNVMTTQKYARLLPQTAARAAAITLNSFDF